ncbi:unnamed protein product [Lepidochelys kempii]
MPSFATLLWRSPCAFSAPASTREHFTITTAADLLRSLSASFSPAPLKSNWSRRCSSFMSSLMSSAIRTLEEVGDDCRLGSSEEQWGQIPGSTLPLVHWHCSGKCEDCNCDLCLHIEAQ